MSEALLSQKQVSEIISLSKAYIYTMMLRDLELRRRIELKVGVVF
jgi:predicted DNA-binding transcriptional regulator AlpA